MDSTDSMFAQLLLDVGWYHAGITRHVAESILLFSGRDGSYLLRDGNDQSSSLALSVRCQNSVKHFKVELEGQSIKFGLGTFGSLQEFLDHFSQQPVVGGDTGSLSSLKYPYPRVVEEPDIFEKVGVHTSVGTPVPIKNTECLLPLASKEGYLTKLGSIHKSWKTRWFTVCKNELKYFKTRQDQSPIRTLDLQDACQVEMDWAFDKPNLFRLVFPSRTFYLYSSSAEESKGWVELLQWKLKQIKRCRCKGKCTCK